jgi:hypothetical protein
MKTVYKYLEFELVMFQCKMLKTKRWNCFNKKHRTYLGEVKWHPRWRQYCFYPDGGTIFSAGCMADIIHFVKQLMEEHKAKKQIKPLSDDLRRDTKAHAPHAPLGESPSLPSPAESRHAAGIWP